VDGGLAVGGLLFLLIGLYLVARSERLTASSFDLNRRVLRRVLGEGRTERMLNPGFQRANVLYGKVFGGSMMAVGVVVMGIALAR
jgi:hypothetical protein